MLFKVAIERGMMITGALTAAAVQWKLVSKTEPSQMTQPPRTLPSK
jgi:hypothetical protein